MYAIRSYYAFAELADVLDRDQRQALADALAARIGEVRACIDGSR